MKKLTAEWIRKAEADTAAARRLVGVKPPLNDPACFHSQQAIEKFLKALLQEYSLSIPHTHDLDVLLDRLVDHDATLESLRRGLSRLTQYAVTYRYPGSHATSQQTRSALRAMESIRQEVRHRLRLRSQ